MASTTEVRRALGDSDYQAVVAVVTLAFSTDPMARWTFPSPATYLTVWPEMIRAFGGKDLSHAAVHVTDGNSAAAIWLPPNVDPDREKLSSLVEQHAPVEQRRDLDRLFEQMETFHPSEPCWYLPVIGVDPGHQGRGLGSALLRYALDRCDRDRVAAYLESSNPRNIPLYERHGFEKIGSIQAGTSPTVIPMLRRAR